MAGQTKNRRAAKSIADPEIVTIQTPTERLVELINQNKKKFLMTEKAEDTVTLMRLTRALFVKYSSRGKVVDKLIEDHDIHERKAWRLVDITPRLFTTVYREMSREFHVDILLENIQETRRLAIATQDWKTASSCDRNYAQAIKDFLGDSKQLKPEDLVLPDIEIGFHPELFKDIPPIDSPEYKKIISNFKKRKDRQEKLEAEDIDYEEIFE
ncbi:hypothetical protein [Jiulongibacter sediminis]|uniref:hypothetical protein n=1 Tax=Jiulongibacter sediminis TaxID=1605367 RepID=UPI0026EA1735|nr:hypothetical protein [Jiulongibacter sediminis]